VVYGWAVTNRTLRNVVIGAATVAAVVLGSTPAWATATVPPEGSEPPVGLTALETIGLFLLLPLVLYAVIALAVMGPSMGRSSRHRTGAALDAGPVWVGADGGRGLDQPVLGHPGTGAPRASDPHSAEQGAAGPRSDAGQRGGASGQW